MPKKLPRKVGQSSGRSTSEIVFYIKTLVFGLLLFAGAYGYTSWQKIPNPLNKSVADVSILLIGLSMGISSLVYFWKSWGWSLAYRKYLGLIGFAFALVHIGLSWSAFLRLFKIETWQQGEYWPLFTGFLAAIVFGVMTAASNRLVASVLGAYWWRVILRAGYLGMLLVWFHVVLLKSGRWVTWYQGGMATPPSMSLMVAVFIAIVLLMRMALWWSSSRKS